MTADHTRPGVLTSRSELVVSDPSRRADVLSILQELLAGFPDAHPMLVEGNAVEADFDDATIVLDLVITGSSFVQADNVSQNLIRSLGDYINTQFPAEQEASPPAVQQMSQTLVPA